MRRWDDDSEVEASGEDWDSGDDRDNVRGFGNDIDGPGEHPPRFQRTRNEKSGSSLRQNSIPGGFRGSGRIPRNSAAPSDSSMFRDSNGDELDTEDDELWGSDYKGEETNLTAPKANFSNYHSSSEESDDNWKHGDWTGKTKKNTDESWDSD
uniref:Uncharacterized protein n=1 Tax=Arundo donax TaxID=35708 RepID=A0A0A9FYA7_ARUDO